jgi:RNA polymerase sigma factor (sigma-70 family)
MMEPVSRALVVEDDPSWQQILSEILEDAALEVDISGTFDDAARNVRESPHRLAVVDLSLSGGDYQNDDGLRILKALHRLDPGCQTILLTGFATVELAVRVLTEYGAFTFLRKEKFNRAQFQDLISKALARAPDYERAGSRSDDKPISPGETSDLSGSQKPYVLVVEDDAGWRSILSELLFDEGCKVRLSASFGDALGHMRREKYALAVVDLSLSDNLAFEQTNSGGQLEGYAILETARTANIPSIVVSGIASAEEIQSVYRDYSIFAYLEKQSFDRMTFQQLVKDALRSNLHASELDCLTEREKEVFLLLSKGMTNKEIAEALVITTNTVKRHIKAIFTKLNLHSRSAAAAKAIAGPT